MISLLAHSSELAVLLWRQHHSVGENVIVPRNGERVGKAKVVDRHRRGLQGPYLRSSAVCEAVKINDDVWLFVVDHLGDHKGGKDSSVLVAAREYFYYEDVSAIHECAGAGVSVDRGMRGRLRAGHV